MRRDSEHLVMVLGGHELHPRPDGFPQRRDLLHRVALGELGRGQDAPAPSEQPVHRGGGSRPLRPGDRMSGDEPLHVEMGPDHPDNLALDRADIGHDCITTKAERYGACGLAACADRHAHDDQVGVPNRRRRVRGRLVHQLEGQRLEAVLPRSRRDQTRGKAEAAHIAGEGPVDEADADKGDLVEQRLQPTRRAVRFHLIDAGRTGHHQRGDAVLVLRLSLSRSARRKAISRLCSALRRGSQWVW